MKKSLWYWGVPKVFTLTRAVQAASWEGIAPKKRAAMERAAARTERRIRRAMGKAKAGPGQRLMFHLVRMMMKKGTFSGVDAAYWSSQGWMGGVRPWRGRV